MNVVLQGLNQAFRLANLWSGIWTRSLQITRQECHPLHLDVWWKSAVPHAFDKWKLWLRVQFLVRKCSSVFCLAQSIINLCVKCDRNVKTRENNFLPQLADSMKEPYYFSFLYFFLPSVTIKGSDRRWRVGGGPNLPFAMTHFSWIPTRSKSEGAFFFILIKLQEYWMIKNHALLRAGENEL